MDPFVETRYFARVLLAAPIRPYRQRRGRRRGRHRLNCWIRRKGAVLRTSARTVPSRP